MVGIITEFVAHMSSSILSPSTWWLIHPIRLGVHCHLHTWMKAHVSMQQLWLWFLPFCGLSRNLLYSSEPLTMWNNSVNSQQWLCDHISECLLFFFPLEERSIRTGVVVHGRQEKEKRRKKEKGSLSEGECVHHDLQTSPSCCSTVFISRLKFSRI